MKLGELKCVKVKVEGKIAFVTMDRPSAMNALNNETLSELLNIIEWLKGKEEVWGVIITGNGKAFVAGADISQMKDYSAEEGRKYANYAQKFLIN